MFSSIQVPRSVGLYVPVEPLSFDRWLLWMVGKRSLRRRSPGHRFLHRITSDRTSRRNARHLRPGFLVSSCTSEKGLLHALQHSRKRRCRLNRRNRNPCNSSLGHISSLSPSTCTRAPTAKLVFAARLFPFWFVADVAQLVR